MGQLVAETERAWRARGQVRYGASSSEEPSLQFRRSLYVVRDVRAGEPLTPENIRAIRPGLGLAPKYLDQILGRHAAVDIRRGTPLAWTMLAEGSYDAR